MKKIIGLSLIFIAATNSFAKMGYVDFSFAHVPWHNEIFHQPEAGTISMHVKIFRSGHNAETPSSGLLLEEHSSGYVDDNVGRYTIIASCIGKGKYYGQATSLRGFFNVMRWESDKIGIRVSCLTTGTALAIPRIKMTGAAFTE